MAKRFAIINVVKPCPACTTPEVYNAWLDSPPKAGLAGFCEDCTPNYKREMMALDRCEHPEIRFCRDEDGFITGSVTKTENQPESPSLDLF